MAKDQGVRIEKGEERIVRSGGSLQREESHTCFFEASDFLLFQKILGGSRIVVRVRVEGLL